MKLKQEVFDWFRGCLFCCILVLMGSPAKAQQPGYETYKQRTYGALLIIQQDSLDAQTQQLVDSLVLAFISPIDDTSLFEFINIALTEVNVNQYDFPLEIGDRVHLMYQEKLKAELSPGERAYIELRHLRLVNNKAQILNLIDRQYEAFEVFYELLQLAKDYQDTTWIAATLREIGISQYNLDEFEKAQLSWEQSVDWLLQQQPVDSTILSTLYRLLPLSYLNQQKYEEARSLAQQALTLAEKQKDSIFIAFALESLSNVEWQTGNVEASFQYGKRALEIYHRSQIAHMRGSIVSRLFKIAIQKGDLSEAEILAADMAVLATESNRLTYQRNLMEARYQLAQEHGKNAEALSFFQSFITLRDSIQREQNVRALLDQGYKYAYIQKAFQDSVSIEQQNAWEQFKLENQVQTRNIGLIGTLLLAMGIGWIAYVQFRSRQQKQRLVKEIQAKNETILQTQDQLIMQEKMASLGQLTMGVAHEIKNPLNFVKNFAEGTGELLREFEEEWEAYQKAPAPEGLDDLRGTFSLIQKHNRHVIQNGDRANEIVNGMMNHANDNRGEKSHVDFNQLIEENLLLAYHGFQPAENTLSIQVEKSFAQTLPLLPLHAQDIGRVIINLVNNACFSLAQKVSQSDADYTPLLRIHTESTGKEAIIRIWDNGTGISDEMRGKIFEPFFTTKPTGRGHVGLGLSISYDLITQGHQGRIEVESEEGEYTQFEVRLPLEVAGQ